MSAPSPAARTLADLVADMQGRVVCLAASKDPNAKMTILLFPAGSDEPSLVAKVPTTAAAAARVLHEADFLRRAARLSLGAIRSTVPTVVEIVDHLGSPVLITAAVPGRPMIASYHSWRHTSRPVAVERDFAAARNWLAGLHRSTATGHVDLAVLADGLAGQLDQRFGDDGDLTEDLSELETLASRLRGTTVAVSVVHGDYWPGNILLQGQAVRGVVDWESARLQGLAVSDFARFALSYALYLDRHTRAGRSVTGHPGLVAGTAAAGVGYAIAGQGWFPELLQDFVRYGLACMGADTELWRDVLLLELLSVAAQADHRYFARQHLLVFRMLVRGGLREAPA